MVKITNGIDIFEVSRGAFDGIYSRQGFSIMEEDVVNEGNVKDIEGNKEIDEDEKFLEEILEKPISKWTKDETMKFVELNDIDLQGKTTSEEIKAIVKDFIDGE